MTDPAPSQPIVVVGVDGSDTARKAAERAAHMARALGARLHIVSAIAKGASSTTIEGPGGDSFYVDASEPVRDQLVDLGASWPDLEITHATPEGKPAEALVEEAARVDATLIVVGNRRMQGIGRVLGAIASDVAHHAPCDVYIAKTTD